MSCVVPRSLAIDADGDAATGASERARRARERKRARDASFLETGDIMMATISTTTTTTTSTATRTATAMATEPRKSYHDLCRLCASYDAIKMHIFGPEGKNRQLVDKIQLFLPFKVSPLCSRSLQR